MNKIKEFLKRNWAYLLGILLALTLIFRNYQYDNLKYKLNEQTNLIKSLNDTTQFWKDKDSLNHAKISVIETDKVNSFLEVQNLKGENKDLQNLVKNYKNKLTKPGNSATNIKTETKYDTSFITNTQVDSNSNYCNDTINDTINNNWIHATYQSYFRSKSERLTNFSLSINQDYSVIIGEDRQGLFKPTKTFVEVLNHNPYTRTNVVKTYQVSQTRVKRVVIGPQFGYGISIPTFNQGFYFGIGGQYKLFEF